MRHEPAFSLALGMLLWFAAGSAMAQPAPEFFVGKWYVADPKACRSKPGGAEGLMTYTRKQVFGYESRCDITRVTPNGKRVELRMNCSAEGEKYPLTEVVEMQGDKLKVTGTLDGKTISFAYRRCP